MLFWAQGLFYVADPTSCSTVWFNLSSIMQFTFSRFFDPHLLLSGISMADSVGIYPRLLYCAACFLQLCAGGVWSTPSAIWFCNGLQEVFDPRLLMYSTVWFFDGFQEVFDPRLLLYVFPMMYRRCFIYAFCYMVCNGLQECSIHTFCYVVLQWFTRVV